MSWDTTLSHGNHPANASERRQGVMSCYTTFPATPRHFSDLTEKRDERTFPFHTTFEDTPHGILRTEMQNARPISFSTTFLAELFPVTRHLGHNSINMRLQPGFREESILSTVRRRKHERRAAQRMSSSFFSFPLVFISF